MSQAIISDNEACVHYYLRWSRGYDRHAGEPPLHTAVRAGNPAIIGLLLVSDRHSPNLPDAQGITPLHLAVEAGRLDLVCALLNHGAHANVLSRDLVSPLDLAQAQQHESIMAILQKGTC